MTILIPAVRLSGAEYITDALDDHAFEAQPVKSYKGGERVYVMDHPIPSKMERMMDIAEDADQILLPVAHPFTVAHNWMLKGFELRPDFYQMLKSQSIFAEMKNVTIIPFGVGEKSVKVKLHNGTNVTIRTPDIGLPHDSGAIHLEADDRERLEDYCLVMKFMQDLFGEESENKPAAKQKAKAKSGAKKKEKEAEKIGGMEQMSEEELDDALLG